MCNLLQHFGLFITTYRAGIYLAAFLGTGGFGYDRIAISMLPGGRDVFFFMIAAGGTGEKFLSFGSTGGIGYDLFLVGVAVAGITSTFSSLHTVQVVTFFPSFVQVAAVITGAP